MGQTLTDRDGVGAPVNALTAYLTVTTHTEMEKSVKLRVAIASLEDQSCTCHPLRTRWVCAQPFALPSQQRNRHPYPRIVPSPGGKFGFRTGSCWNALLVHWAIVERCNLPVPAIANRDCPPHPAGRRGRSNADAGGEHRHRSACNDAPGPSTRSGLKGTKRTSANVASQTGTARHTHRGAADLAPSPTTG